MLSDAADVPANGDYRPDSEVSWRVDLLFMSALMNFTGMSDRPFIGDSVTDTDSFTSASFYLGGSSLGSYGMNNTVLCPLLVCSSWALRRRQSVVSLSFTSAISPVDYSRESVVGSTFITVKFLSSS